MIVPVAYIVLKLGGNPESVYVVHGCIAIITQFARVYMMRNLIDLPMTTYFRNVIVPIILVAFGSFIIPFIVYMKMEYGVASFFTVCCLSILSVMVCSYYLGTNKFEKEMIQSKAHSFLKRLHR